MSWRVVVVSGSAKVDYKADYLVIRTLDGTKKIHMSEIGVVVLESTAVSVTAYALCELTRYKVKVIFCDHQRNPYGELVASHGSHDSSAKIRQQMQWLPQNCQIVWTEIVRQKIKYQRNVLRHWDKPQSELLSSYLSQLQLGDSTNREGHAAKVYFNALFGVDFTRADDNAINAALNYGYSMILSAVNREIAAAGYLTQLGIFHQNTYNPFNLGSDFMEPLRPLIDQTVIKLTPVKFDKEEKHALINALNSEVQIDGRNQYLLYALRIYCAGLFRALQSGDTADIKFIEYEL